GSDSCGILSRRFSGGSPRPARPEKPATSQARVGGTSVVRGEEDREPGMRVLYVCADAGISLDGTKGAAVHVRQTLGALEDRGVKITVLALRPGHPGAIPGQVLAPGDFRAHNRSKAAGTIAAEASAIASASDLTGGCPLSPGEV